MILLVCFFLTVQVVRFGSDLQNTCKGYYVSKWVLSREQVKAATISSSVQYILLSFSPSVCYMYDDSHVPKD